MWTGVLLGRAGVLSAENLPIIWLIFEVNLISFIPLISSKWRTKKTIILYFVVQRIGSLMILRGGVISDEVSSLSKWIPLGVLLKSRLAPLHFWGAVLVNKLRALVALVFLSWQKIAPIFLLFYRTSKNILIIIVAINILSSVSARGTKDLRVLLFFSGLLHMRWIITAPIVVSSLYFFIYIITLLPLFTSRKNLPLLLLNQAGIPPLTGFFIKLRILQTINFRAGCLLILSSAPLLYSYLRNFLMSAISDGPIKARTVVVCSIGLIL